MTIEMMALEEEFYNPQSGFQIIEPFRNRKEKRPKGSFLKKVRSGECKKETVNTDYVIRAQDLRALDMNDLKESVFHRLWLAGYVDRHGKGTPELANAILEQTRAFEGDLKCADLDLVELISAAKNHWQAFVVRKKGWSGFYLAASLLKAGWFDNSGALLAPAIEFVKTANQAKAYALAPHICLSHIELLYHLEDYRKDYPIERAEGNCSVCESWEQEKAIITWLLKNKMIDERWRPTEFGYLVVKLRLSQGAA